MATSKYFRNFGSERKPEQLLYEDLIVESIKINGHDAHYLPRESLDTTDTLFGENVNSHFTKSYAMEVYIGTIQGFTGDQDFFSKFGLEIRDNATFTVARRTFEKYVPKNVLTRPREGDLLWVPVMNRIFEIKFIEEENEFFSLGNKMPYTYEMRCEVFRYSNETIDVGVDEIDKIDDKNSYTVEMIVSGDGDFEVGETVYQGASSSNTTMTGTVSGWDSANNSLSIIDISGTISSNSALVGANSNTSYLVTIVDTMGDNAYYDQYDNKRIQDEANTFVSLAEVDPFGYP